MLCPLSLHPLRTSVTCQITIGMKSGVGIIERAFELAGSVPTINEIKDQLKKEGYSSVDAHLAGKTLRSELATVLKRGARSKI